MAYTANSYDSKQYLDYTGLSLYDTLIKGYIDDADALSIKAINTTTVNGVTYVNYWKTESAGTASTSTSGEGAPAYIVQIPNGAAALAVAATNSYALTGLTDNGDGTFTWTAAAFDEDGAADTALATAIGTSADGSSANTIYGAKAYADEATTNAIADLDATADIVSIDGDIIYLDTQVVETDGEISASGTTTALAAVAKTGAAANVSLVDSSDSWDSTNVEDAFEEVATAIADALSDSEVTVAQKATPNQGAQVTYTLSQGGSTVADIDIPEFPVDAFVSGGSVGTVTEADVPYSGAAVGDYYIALTLTLDADHDQEYDEGETQETIYIPANGLVPVYSVSDTGTIDMDLTNNTFSASVIANSLGTTAMDATVTSALNAATSAVQLSGFGNNATSASGSTNAEFSVTDGSGNTAYVQIDNLGSAAYADTTDFDEAGAAAAEAAAVYAAIGSIPSGTEGTSGDTIYGLFA